MLIPHTVSIINGTGESVGRGRQGSWQKFERGEIDLLSFYKAFSRDLSDTVNGNKWRVIYYHMITWH